MMKHTALALSLAALIAFPAQAQNVQGSKDVESPNAGLYELIDQSDGYFNIRQNVVMIEGETEIKACHFGLTPEFFAAYGAGDAARVEAMQPTVVCVSLEDMSVADTASAINSSSALFGFIDNSESYVQVAQSIVMIEGETSIEFCHFDLKDEYFAAVAAKDEAGMTEFQPSVICAPFGDVSK